MSFDTTSISPEQTRRLGFKLAQALVKTQPANSIVLALTGDLGSGKTTFVQGLAAGFSIRGRVISPTFILMRQHPISPSSLFKNLYHIDLYRLGGIRDVPVLGLAELWGDKSNVLVIEWAEKIQPLLPRWTNWIRFSAPGESTRIISSDLFRSLFK